MLSTEFEAATPAIKQLQTYALDSRATGIEKEKLFYTSIIIVVSFFFFLVQQPPMGQDLLIHKVSRSHTTTHYSS